MSQMFIKLLKGLYCYIEAIVSLGKICRIHVQLKVCKVSYSSVFMCRLSVCNDF